MRAEVIAIGSELLLGQIVDTNSAVIARHFAAIGLDLFYKTTVGDNLARATAVVRKALDRADIVLTTGGIGPTADDVTREAVAAATERQLEFSPLLLAQIETFFAARGLRLSPSNRRQAYVPRGALPIENPVGTAPAFIVELGDKAVVTLPGVPREMEHLLTTRVVSHLKARYGLGGEIRLRVLRAAGLGESRIGELLGDVMERGANPTVGTLAHLGQVDVRIAAKAGDGAAAEALIAPLEALVRQRLGAHVFGADGATLEGEVARLLGTLGARLAIVELGSGGVAASRLAAVAGVPLAAALVLVDAADAQLIGVAARDARGADALASAVARWARAGVGAAAVVAPGSARAVAEPTAGEVAELMAPGMRTVTLAVAVDGRAELREHRLGGDPVSVNVRTGTLLLDFIRRRLEADAGSRA